MRILFLSLALLMVSSRSAYAIKPASKADIDAIEAQLLIAKGMDDQILAAKKKSEEAALKVETTDAELAALDKAVDREKAKQRAAQTRAIHMTILAWGLAPANLSGTSFMRWTKGRTIVWLPVAGEGEDRQVLSAKGKRNVSKKPEEAFDGITYHDGVTFISKETFEHGPGYLASTLLHELTHFKQYTTDGKGNAMSKAERQEEAFQAEVDNAGYFFDPKKDKDMINQTKGFLRAEKAKVKLEKSLAGLLRRFIPSDGQPDKSEAKVHTNAELADISGLVAQARAQADIARREREKREAIAQSAAEKAARRDHDERLESTMNDMATRSVMRPGSVIQSELDKLPQRHAQDISYLANPGVWESAYLYLYNGGRDAEELRRLSAPALKPVDALIPAPPQAVQPVRPTPAAPVSARTPFASTLPGLKELAVTACHSRGQVPIDRSLTHPSPPYSAWDERDARTADGLSAGLENCEGRLFRRLIELIRAGQGDRVTAQWVQETAAQYRAEAGAAPGYTPPQTGGGDPCRDNGNIRCP